mgnify:CR=1 FL=1
MIFEIYDYSNRPILQLLKTITKYFTRIYSYVTRVLLLCTREGLVSTRVWFYLVPDNFSFLHRSEKPQCLHYATTFHKIAENMPAHSPSLPLLTEKLFPIFAFFPVIVLKSFCIVSMYFMNF